MDRPLDFRRRDKTIGLSLMKIGLRFRLEPQWVSRVVHTLFFFFQPCELIVNLSLNVFWTMKKTSHLKQLQ
ncbi:MAG: hypothetical protein ACQERB_14855 [Promethearchaeati archaeon]